MIAATAHLEDVVFVLMGPARPEYLAQLRAVAERAGVSGRVHFVPAVPSADVPAYAAAADVGVIPFPRTSMNHWLSLPNKLFEYLAAGLPVVSVAFPELERIVTGYDVGRVCAPEDLEALAAAVRAVLDDPAELERLRANAARAAKELTWENEEPAYLAAVARALS
jgi:glycosyltransferase involved in cell wall biosynthesis